MIAELKEMGIELMVSIWPTVDYRSENFKEMDDKGLLIRVESGYPISMDFMGNTLHYDATNPEAREYVWQKAKQNYYEKGIKVFWLDEAEPEYTVYDFENYRYYRGTDLEIGNIYPVEYARTFYEGMEEKVLRLAEEKGLEDRMIYSSFNHYSMKKLQKLLPSARIAFLYSDGILDIADYAERYGAYSVHPSLKNVEYPDMVRECHDRNIKVHVWTVNKEEDFEKMRKMEVDAVITNYVERG